MSQNVLNDQLKEKYGVDAQGLLDRYGGLTKSQEIVDCAPPGAECYSWSLGESGVRDKTVELADLRLAIEAVKNTGVQS